MQKSQELPSGLLVYHGFCWFWIALVPNVGRIPEGTTPFPAVSTKAGIPKAGLLAVEESGRLSNNVDGVLEYSGAHNGAPATTWDPMGMQVG